ncbi:MAG: MFS transporter [Pseudomonadota bacterium]
MSDYPLAVQKIRLRLILPFMLLLIISSLDRANVSFAALQMNAELGLSPKAYGLAVSSFFVGYLLFQFPSMAILRRIGARKWIFGSVLMWGIFATAMVFVHNAISLYILRCLLGLAEAGFAPGIVYLCSRWMPKQYRAAAIGTTMLAVPVSVLFGGPFSGWLMSIQNPLSMAGWRWMFLAEGALTITFALLALKIFVDSPAQASWLSAQEKQWLKDKIADDDRDAAATGLASTGAAFRSPRLWACAGVWFVMIAGAYGILFWLPQVVKQIANRSVLETSIISALPWLGIGLGMFFNARHSDRTQERFWHVMLPMILCSACLALATLSSNKLLSLALLFIGGVGLGGAQGVFWAIPTSFLGKEAAGQGITAINFFGNLGGLFGPYAIGLIREVTGSFVAPVYAMALMVLLGAMLMLIVRGHGATRAATANIGAVRKTG